MAFLCCIAGSDTSAMSSSIGLDIAVGNVNPGFTPLHADNSDSDILSAGAIHMERTQCAISDAGTCLSARCNDGTACNVNYRQALISAANSSSALILISARIDRRVDRTACDRHICVRILTSSDSSAHVIRRIGSNVASINRDISAIIPRTFIRSFA